MGIGILDSFFEVGSALSTTGISMGATTVVMPIGYKWLMILAMTIGRIEIVGIFTALGGFTLLATLRRRVPEIVKDYDRLKEVAHAAYLAHTRVFKNAHECQ
jgi:uncharacterized membrane protein